MKEKAFLQSRIANGRNRFHISDYQSTDSTSNIEISGVTVHKAKISRYEVSRISKEM